MVTSFSYSEKIVSKFFSWLPRYSKYWGVWGPGIVPLLSPGGLPQYQNYKYHVYTNDSLKQIEQTDIFNTHLKLP